MREGRRRLACDGDVKLVVSPMRRWDGSVLLEGAVAGSSWSVCKQSVTVDAVGGVTCIAMQLHLSIAMAHVTVS